MLHRTARIACALAVAAFAVSGASAHEREFTLSRDWFLPYQGEFEVETRNFFDTGHGIYSGELEFEWGITKHFAIEPGIAYREKDDENNEFEMEAASLELRFNFGDFAYDKFLSALNLEYEHPFHEDEDPKHAEAKFIVARYGKNGVDFVANVNVGRELNMDKEWEEEITLGGVMPLKRLGEELGEDLGGAGWRQVPRIGLELIEDLKEHNTGIGPLFVYRATSHLNFLASYVFGIDDRDEDNADVLTIIAEWEF
jgi:hypothetical protein